MAVRVRVRIGRSGAGARARVETVAVANSGFEAAEPEALLPVRVAERLGLWPPPPGAQTGEVASPVGTARLVTFPRVLRVQLVGGRRGVRAHALVAEREDEVVLNDWLVSALRIDLADVGRGLWRIGPRGRMRKSDPPERW